MPPHNCPACRCPHPGPNDPPTVKDFRGLVPRSLQPKVAGKIGINLRPASVLRVQGRLPPWSSGNPSFEPLALLQPGGPQGWQESEKKPLALALEEDELDAEPDSKDRRFARELSKE